MEYVIIIGIVITLGICFYVLKNILIKKNFEKILNELDKKYLINKLKKHNFDYTLEDNEKIIYFKILPIPNNSAVTINSKTTWCLTWGGSSYNIGRAYPNKRYMNEVVNAINMKIESNKEVIKVFVLYQSTEHIYKYRNESEIDEISSKNTPYGYKVISYNKLIAEFDDLFVLKA